MKRNYLFAGILFCTFFVCLGVCTLFAESDAKEIRESVLRFHIVANSDSEKDQADKLAVRDGIASLCSELFYSSEDKKTAMQKAQDNCDAIVSKASEILALRGSDNTVSADVTQRFFPTRHYDGVSLPAGVYDTVDITIGEGQGKNFWCVMFPDICVGASGARTNYEKMSGVLDGDSLEMATDSKNIKVQFKFKLVELFENIKNLFSAAP